MRLPIEQRRPATSSAALAVLFIAACTTPDAATGPQPSSPSVLTVQSPESPVHLRDQYIITLAGNTPDVAQAAQELAASAKGDVIRTYAMAIHGFAARIPAGRVEALGRNPIVQSIEPDQVIRPSGPNFSTVPWGLDRVDQLALPLDGKYTSTNTGDGINVYIVDSGIRRSHVEFGTRVGPGYSVVNDTLGTADCLGHGTHVAGTVAGSTMGIARGATIHPVRVFGCSGETDTNTLLAALDWILLNGTKPAVVNMSLGSDVPVPSVDSAVSHAVAQGFTIVVAAGNSADDACNHSPAAASSAITVAASTRYDQQAGFSNYGPCVDIYAPGSGVKSAWFSSDTSYAEGSGTSMSSPHVAGAAALYLQSNPSAAPSDVAQALLNSAVPGILTYLGAGSPNRLLHTSSFAAAPPGPNDPPTAAFTYSCRGLRCSFDASASTDDRGVISYQWIFGPKTIATTNPRTSYKFATPGTYTVMLTVIDASGLTNSQATAMIVTR